MVQNRNKLKKKSLYQSLLSLNAKVYNQKHAILRLEMYVIIPIVFNLTESKLQLNPELFLGVYPEFTFIY